MVKFHQQIGTSMTAPNLTSAVLRGLLPFIQARFFTPCFVLQVMIAPRFTQ